MPDQSKVIAFDIDQVDQPPEGPPGLPDRGSQRRHGLFPHSGLESGTLRW